MSDWMQVLSANIYTLINQKGGVGKTTETIHLSRAATNAGLKVLVVDADPQGNLSGILAQDEVAADQMSFADLLVGESVEAVKVAGIWNGLSVIPGSPNTTKAILQIQGEHGREYRLKEALDEVRSNYDLILIDCAPSLELHTVNALAAADKAVVMTQPGKFSLDGLSLLQKSFESVQKYYNPNLHVAGVVINGVRKTIGHQTWIEQLKQASPWPIINPQIPFWTIIQDATEAAYGLDEWTIEKKRSREAYEMYAAHLAALEGLNLEDHLNAVFHSQSPRK